jgi:hypothetical protein
VAQVVQPDHGHGGVGLAAASHIACELAPDALRVPVTAFYVAEYQGVIPASCRTMPPRSRLCWRRTATVCGVQVDNTRLAALGVALGYRCALASLQINVRPVRAELGT